MTKKVTVTVSPANQLTKQDLMKWAVNLLIYSVPMLILLLSFVQKQISLEALVTGVMVYVLNSLIDLGRKYKSSSYEVKQ